MTEALKIANCSGFYGDRLAAAREMVDGGPIDVLSGDWLAELTMLILAKGMLRSPSSGYARTFVAQMEDVMGDCLDKGIKVVSNAGGLAPGACADAVADVADKLGLKPKIATVSGDNLMDRASGSGATSRFEELRDAGIDFSHLETGQPLGDRKPITANAYLGGWGIAEALGAGADIVITGRVTDAAVAMGPAAWRHGWKRDDWDALAGALVAGHVIECGPQATGGNYAFFKEIPGLEHPGFPIAEITRDGSSVITKHPEHGGAVTVGTVTAQLLYEIGAPEYPNPDVTAHFDTISLAQVGTDRVQVSGVQGSPPPETVKVALNYVGGHRTSATLFLTGLDIEEKAELVSAGLWSKFPKGRETFEETDVQLLRTDHDDPTSNEAAMAQLRITVRDSDDKKLGRAFSSKVTELALANYPGLCGSGMTAKAEAYGVYWPAVVPAKLIHEEVRLGYGAVGAWDRRDVRILDSVGAESGVPVDSTPSSGGRHSTSGGGSGKTVRVPLGKLFGARSGDKGGNANLGVWARNERAYEWLAANLTTARLKQLLPETAQLEVRRFPLPNLFALNFVVVDILGEGVAASSRVDPQAKSLGEWLRARVVDIPAELVGWTGGGE